MCSSNIKTEFKCLQAVEPITRSSYGSSSRESSIVVSANVSMNVISLIVELYLKSWKEENVERVEWK